MRSRYLANLATFINGNLTAGRGRGDRGRVPPPLQDGQVQHSEGEQGPGQQEVLQEVLNLNFPPLTVSPSPTQKAMSNKN